MFGTLLTDISEANYANDTISYAVSNNMDDLIFGKMLMQMT